MYQTISEETMAALGKIDTPSICNAIEAFDARPRNAGFMLADIKGIFRDLPPAVGYAVTGVISADRPEGRNLSREDWVDFILSVPAPRFIVLHDIDNPPRGAFWGEVQGNIHQALGAVGAATDGTVRDIDEVHELGFQFFAQGISPSRAYVHLVEIGIPVNVGGLTIHTGDLMHGDKHGVTNIPLEIAAEIPAMAETLADYEQKTITLCQSPEFTPEKLKEVLRLPRPTR